MHTPQITPKVERLLRRLQPHNQGVLAGKPTAPALPSYLGGARSYRGARALNDTIDDLNLSYAPANGEWTHIVPWGVIYPGLNHSSSNTAVEISAVRVGWLPHQSDEWVKIDYDVKDDITQTLGYKELPYICSQIETVLTARKNVPINFVNPIHFWKNGKIEMPVKPQELRAVYAGFKMKTVLVDGSGIDDRDLSELYINSAYDFYPDGTTVINSGLPMGCSSRFTKAEQYEQIIECCSVESTGQIFRNSSYKGSVLLPLRDFLLTDHENLLTW